MPGRSFAATNISRPSAGENAEITPNTLEEVMTLPTEAQRRAASDKEVVTPKNNNVCTLLPVNSVPAGHNIIDSRWVYKVKRRVVELGWGKLPDIGCGSTFAHFFRLQSICIPW